jgi:hypothetical protein
MLILLGVLLAALSTVCCCAIAAYSRLTASPSTRPEEDEFRQWDETRHRSIAGPAPTNTRRETTAGPVSPEGAAVDIATWQEQERRRRMAVRLEAVIERSRRASRTEKKCKAPAPFVVASRNSRASQRSSLRRFWAMLRPSRWVAPKSLSADLLLLSAGAQGRSPRQLRVQPSRRATVSNALG